MIKKIQFNLNLILFLFAVVIYLFTRFLNIEDFPIYFFSDEAIQAVKAEELLNNGFKDDIGKTFPLFFHRFSSLYNLGITPYFHIPAVLIFGKKIWATRGTVVIISSLGTIITSLILKNIFKVKRYWLAVLFFATTPLHFLFTRSAFEGGITLTFYAAFLYFYFLYRSSNVYYIFPCIFFSALTFYSYSGIYIVLIITCLLFILSDMKFHIKNFRINLLAIFFTILLFYPAIHFQVKNPNLTENQLSVYGSYLTKDITLKEKIFTFGNNYITVYSPKFLFVYHPTYHVRHYIKGYGYFPIWSAPFIILGVIYLLLHIKNSSERSLLLALLAAPLGGALIEPGSHRILVITVLLTIIFGLSFKYIEQLEEKYFNKKLFIYLISLVLFFFLSSQAIYLTYYSLKTGPLWFQDYGLYGMQYGAKQLFTEINKSLDRYKLVIASPNYANATDIYTPFFIPKNAQNRVKLRDTREFVIKLLPTKNTIIFSPVDEYNELRTSNRFRYINIKKIIMAPNKQPLFYKIELGYKKEIQDTEQLEEIN